MLTKTTIAWVVIILLLPVTATAGEYDILSKEKELMLLDKENIRSTDTIGLFETQIYTVQENELGHTRQTLYLDCQNKRWTRGSWVSYDKYGRLNMETIVGFDKNFDRRSFSHRFAGTKFQHNGKATRVEWVYAESNAQLWNAPYGVAFRIVCQAKFSPSKLTAQSEKISRETTLYTPPSVETIKGFSFPEIFQSYRNQVLNRKVTSDVQTRP